MPPFHEIIFWKAKIFLPERAILAARLDEKAGKRYNPLRATGVGPAIGHRFHVALLEQGKEEGLSWQKCRN